MFVSFLRYSDSLLKSFSGGSLQFMFYRVDGEEALKQAGIPTL